MLSTNDLNLIRTTAAESLTEAAVIYRTTETASASGGRTQISGSVVSTTGRVGVSGNMPFERIIAEKVGGAVLYRVTLPALTDVREGDGIVINSKTYRVIGILHPTYETARVCICKEVI